jgi:hypothetical protein
MAQTLDVLVMESHPHAADEAEAALVAAGHRVHRCHEPGGHGFPCVGVIDPAACPLDRGVDVALLVRRRVAPRPTPWEGGVSCVIRAGVPLVEAGPDVLDPFERWVVARSDGDVGQACRRALEAGRSSARMRWDVDVRDQSTTRLAPGHIGSLNPELEVD